MNRVVKFSEHGGPDVLRIETESPADPAPGEIRVRMSAIDEEVWPSPAMKKKIAPDTGSSIAFSKFTLSGVLPFAEVVQPLFDEINEMYGTDVKPIFTK